MASHVTVGCFLTDDDYDQIFSASHTDPYVLEQAYAQDEENEPPIDPTGDPLDDDEEEPADASYVTGWDQHGPSYE